eukprot:9523325-Alexandrium_andersonii.AAC.1
MQVARENAARTQRERSESAARAQRERKVCRTHTKMQRERRMQKQESAERSSDTSLERSV